jgi:hypothetical protein
MAGRQIWASPSAVFAGSPLDSRYTDNGPLSWPETVNAYV